MKMPDMGKMIGPLPLGAWIVVGGVGVGIAWYIRRGSSGSETPTEVEDTSGVPGVGVGGGGGAGWISTPPPDTSGDGTGSGNGEPTTNGEWGQAAIRWLVSRGYEAAAVDQAVRRYLGGEAISAVERIMISEAITRLGPVPELLPAAPELPKPETPKPEEPKPKPTTPKPAPPKPKVRYYTVKRGDTLWDIAVKYYKNGADYGRIYNANRKGKKRADGTNGMISNPKVISPGWKLIIP